jgi:hypothetical protein
LSRTSNSPLWAFITVKELLAVSGQILVAINKEHSSTALIAAVNR